MRIFGSVFRISVLGLILVFSHQPETRAGKWRTVQLSDTAIIFKGWPGADDCRFGKKMADDYSSELTVAQCPRYTTRGSTSTFILVNELSPGFFWSGTAGEDIRESTYFKKPTGWFSNFYGAEFDPDQRFVCYRDSECAWRRINFKVKENPCQIVEIIPGVGGTNDFYGQRDSRMSLTLVHCGTDKPITNKHIVYGEETITLIYPGRDALPKPKASLTEASDPVEIRKEISTLESERTTSEQRCVHGESTHCRLADQKRLRIGALRERLKALQ